ncbi:RNA-guided pseudouridylation complex pseudouridine synthase subunit Cbf5 [Methanothermococcus okinawensis]|uniref:Probable tRNA pseudouridine synthase B n=1 Tax=Methanothermococcus okinawensis (strain DSM 14208 / JCM 11175 / IH1) TaxID=647113 RepID=F8AM99_METOI|nr:RNA-guided pseudouridylation complex pseudouridine synthase subunit Cbf5 [Methanothermococcus okinawensis]AEH06789.1 tRNA pseudouridine synthase B [Methanothermococcus okinawensis IH1]
MELITREESKTNYEYGFNPYNRPIAELLQYGLVVIDKPSGPTSHEVSSWVKKILHLNLAGHAGTLDPKVTGVLPVALENTTKCIQVWHMLPKEYVCLMHLHRDATEEDIIRIFKEFEGRIFQRPPLKAAVKRSLRIRKIHKLELLEMDGRDVLFKVKCQSGTYIRTLAEDIGEALGTSAHMQELRRTKSGPFGEEEAVYLQDLTDAYVFWKEEGNEEELRKIVKPMEYGLRHLKKIVIKDSAVDAICHGADVYLNGIAKLSKGIGIDEIVLIETLKGEAVAIGKALLSTKNILKETEYTNPIVDTERVLMKPGTYPRMWKGKKGKNRKK